MTSSSGSRHRITPAACTPHCRFRPSSPRAVSTTRLTSGSVSYSVAELAGLLVARVLGVEDAGQRDVLAHHRRRHDLGDPVAHRERVAEHPGGVLDRLLGLDRAVGDDLRDPVLAVLLGGVADHVAAPALVEVQVDVGHRDALGVEEPLEQQPVLDRVELGDAQRVGDHRRRPPSRGRGRPGCRCSRACRHEVGDDEEVAREAHLDDDAELVLRLLARGRPGTPPGSGAASPRSTSLRQPATPRSRPSGTGNRGIRLRWRERRRAARARRSAACCRRPPGSSRHSCAHLLRAT